MNKEAFLKLEISNISQVYFGKRDCCRCGCGGEYTATSYKLPEQYGADIDDALVAKRLKRAKKLVLSGADAQYGDIYIDVQTGKDRTLTFYIDDLKPTPGN